ncbi:MAG: hypothetical protein LBQ36_09290 [Synergistaceae bacterium]|nr:hypothetical protein [Synergistaceae bacterium]
MGSDVFDGVNGHVTIYVPDPSTANGYGLNGAGDFSDGWESLFSSGFFTPEPIPAAPEPSAPTGDNPPPPASGGGSSGGCDTGAAGLIGLAGLAMAGLRGAVAKGKRG